MITISSFSFLKGIFKEKWWLLKVILGLRAHSHDILWWKMCHIQLTSNNKGLHCTGPLICEFRLLNIYHMIPSWLNLWMQRPQTLRTNSKVICRFSAAQSQQLTWPLPRLLVLSNLCRKHVCVHRKDWGQGLRSSPPWLHRYQVTSGYVELPEWLWVVLGDRHKALCTLLIPWLLKRKTLGHRRKRGRNTILGFCSHTTPKHRSSFLIYYLSCGHASNLIDWYLPNLSHL